MKLFTIHNWITPKAPARLRNWRARFPFELSQRAKLVAANAMRAGLAALYPVDMQRCRSPVDLLLPAQVPRVRLGHEHVVPSSIAQKASQNHSVIG